MANHGYKKYMKSSSQTKDYTLVKLFLMVFFGMLLVFTFLIKSFSPSVDVSIGDYKHDNEIEEEANPVDGRLAMIQDEDQGKRFSDLMEKAEDVEASQENRTEVKLQPEQPQPEVQPKVQAPAADPVYRVFIGSYSSADQAKVAKDIILDTGINLNPIVKCIGTNNYTLQVGSFKNKASADAMLSTVQMNHLPGRIVQEY